MDKLCGRINVYILDIPGILVYVAFDIALKILWTERFGLEGLHQLYTPGSVQKPMQQFYNYDQK